ncbi:MipA/OmpV family protein [uncultured Algimonas sp.]|uniref:MipA/OmpV family protein n=1 Tax=uncultured Algimonas sp. TaxID=1547920 RepID=UPI0026224395|nr:MipA/OmpV family protein [uncultured Algimonas sp.]
MRYMLAILIGLCAFDASAQDETDRTIRLGGALAYIPEYAGSGDYDLRILPFIAFDDIAGFELNGLALTYPLIDAGTGRGPGQWSFTAGPRAAFDFGRDSEDSPTLTGFEDIGASLLTGGFARATYGPLGFRIDAGQDVIGGHEGFIADVSVGTFIPEGVIADKFALAPALTLSWADGNHNQAVYGVTPQQAAASGLPVYDLSGGFHRASANLVGFYQIDERWQITTILSYREYLGDYRDSPILRAPDGVTSDVFTLIGISRTFTL